MTKPDQAATGATEGNIAALTIDDHPMTEEERAEKERKAAERKAAKEAKKAAKASKAAKKKKNEGSANHASSTTNRDGMEVKKSEDFGAWYNQIVTKAELMEFYDISGCYILRPWSFAMWDSIREYFDAEIKKLGVQNSYFPLFVTQGKLATEEEHLEDFSAEVAWVTRGGKKDLEEPIAIRPTSETIMYSSFAKWIRSHRDLPMKLNQWTNVVRWEFKYPTPFIRSREFLWQEGHTAYADKESADMEVLQILDLYRSVYEGLLAVPVIKGKKSENEKFAGGVYTTTIEGFIPANGRAVQAATSHGLGQNFAKMFKIVFEGTNGKQFVWQNCWGLTTRSIGIMVMVHGDDKGLVLPPRIAPIQVVIVPILKKGMEATVTEHATALADELEAAGIRVKADTRDDKNPGWKFNYWELKGVPLRLELGPRDIEQGVVAGTTRVDSARHQFKREGFAEVIKGILDNIHQTTLEKARAERDAKIRVVTKWEDFVPTLEQRTMVLAPWCEGKQCEENSKERSKQESEQLHSGAEEAEQDDRALSGAAKTLCIPFEEEIARLGVEKFAEGTQCFACCEKAVSYTLWGRSY